MTADVERAASTLKHQGLSGAIDTVVALGSGNGSPAETLSEVSAFAYETIPGFPSAVHSGRLVVGSFEGSRVAVMEGRAEFGYPDQAAGFRLPLRTLATFGARVLVSVCQAVSLHADIYPGALVVVSDHINLSGLDPLANADAEHRFGSMKDAYDPRLRRRFKAAAAASGVAAQEGVHVSMPGVWPETAAEARMARTIGGDVLGAMLAQEALVARWLGLRVAGIAVVTGIAAGIGLATPAGGAKDATLAGSIGLRRLLRAFLRPSEE